MKILPIFTAIAATALIGGAAYAQEQQPAPTTAAPLPGSTAADATAAAQAAAPTGQAVTTSTTTATDPSGASLTTSTTTNGPVADTPENRKKYGGPMSHAGKRTKPAGN